MDPSTFSTLAFYPDMGARPGGGGAARRAVPAGSPSLGPREGGKGGGR